MPSRFHARVVLLLAVLAVGWSAGRAEAQSAEGNGLWFAYFDSGKPVDLDCNRDERLLTWFDAHLRFLDDADGFTQSIVRPGVGWKTGDDSAIWGGYAYIRTSPVANDGFDENRLWQQATWTPSLGSLDFQFRSRFEQRWLETGDDVGLRWRQLTRVQKVIQQVPTITAVVWDELFFHLNDTDWGAEAGLNQNRAFIGFGYKRCPHARWRTEIGYLNQAINLPGGDNRTNHILSINFFR